MPEGTDPTGYQVVIYMYDGTVYNSFSLDTPEGTMGGHDVYVIDDTSLGFPTSDPTGNLYPDDAIALVDPDGNVVQFVSYWDNTVTATEGPAAGMTSTDVGTADAESSLQSDDGGTSYYTQSSTNPGVIAACCAPGSIVLTSDGMKPVENLSVGDCVVTPSGEQHPILWTWNEDQPLDDLRRHQKPVLISKDALGPGRPVRDMIVSGQHRIVVGGFGQLTHMFDAPVMVSAKSLGALKSVRFMHGRRSIRWHHFLCDTLSVAMVDGLASESLLPGPVLLHGLSAEAHAEIEAALPDALHGAVPCRSVLPCLTVGEARRVRRAHSPQEVRQARVA